MIPHDEFRNLYHSRFEPELRKLERGRIKPVIAALMALTAASFMFFRWSDNGAYINILMIFFTIVFVTITIQWYRDYRRGYKHKIVAEIIRLINPDFKFFYDHHMPLKTFIRSGLYYEKPDDCKGDDYVSGTIDGTTFKFSELKVTAGQNQERIQIFRGLFFQMSSNYQLKEPVYLFPDESAYQLEEEWQKEQLAGRDNRIRMTHDQFEREFSVFGRAEKEARTLLGPHMIHAILELDKLLGKRIKLSFVGSDIYCAIPYGGRIFEPKLIDSGVYPGTVMNIYQHFELIDKIVRLLNLNPDQIEEDRQATAHVIRLEHKTNELNSSPDNSKSIEAPGDSQEVTEEPVIDKSLNLPALKESITGFNVSAPERDLKRYLLALYRNMLALKEEVLTQELLTKMLFDSFTSEAMTMDESWLGISIKPERDKMYRKAQNADDLGFFTRPEHTGWSDFEFTEEVLRFQIAELHKMEGNQLENEMKEYGVASETGTPWYNFDPISNLSSGIQQLIDQQYHVDTIDWSIVGLIFQHGRVNA
ncbi:MAG: hypothetical protein Roseis2KO_34050 [Roseivirga sp.]